MSARRYRVPTHLGVEPSLLRAELGPIPVDLTFRQAAARAAAAGLSYWLWQGSGLPLGLALPLALAALAVALVTAFITIGGRSADRWLHAVLRYGLRPHRLVWRAAPTAAREPAPASFVTAPLTLAWAPTRATTPAPPDGLAAD